VLKKYLSLGVSMLAVVVALAMMAGPADARARRHHRHHRGGGGGGGGVTCGPGTVLVNGVCTAVPPSGPVGNGNVNISPNSVTMNLDGSFSASVVVSGLPPAIGITSSASATCGPNGTFVVAATGATDALGRLQALVFKGAPGCVPGSYPITFAETGSPFQVFTGFLQLHF
jgi:hypothetical protein